VLGEVRVEVLDLLLRQLDVLEPVDDLVVGEKALLFSLGDELVELLDLRKRDVDGEHVPEPPGLVVARRHCYNRPRPACAGTPVLPRIACRILVASRRFVKKMSASSAGVCRPGPAAMIRS